MKEFNYHVKALKDKKNDCTYIGYTTHDITPGQSKTKIFKSDSMNNIRMELAAIKMALLDIESRYNTETRYNIYSQSRDALNLIADNDFNKYSEVQEINEILNRMGQNIGVFEFSENGNNNTFITSNSLLSLKKADQVLAGQRIMKETLRWTERSGVADRYVSTPFIIKL